MSVLDVFMMPKTVNITGRSSSITNAFVNGIIPAIYPTEEEIMQSLEILGLDANDLRCAYCGDPATEWDHLRPLVKDKKPTGYISEIYNLVPVHLPNNALHLAQAGWDRYWGILKTQRVSLEKRIVAFYQTSAIRTQ